MDAKEGRTPNSRGPGGSAGRNQAADGGDSMAVSRIMPAVYDELRRLARHYLRGERARSLQATALVNEAYLKLAGDKSPAWRNRTHFFAIAATSMRQILVERARARNAAKRGGGGQVRITLDDALAASGQKSVDLLALDEALTRLAVMDPEQVRIVELRFFGGLTVEETAEEMGISTATVKRGWSMAKAWLRLEMEKEGAQ